ncbi:hypothetical protein Ae168Ps1_2130c [Pseudonocardia sp. Ae168_Ps1]|nr:hypothetical protein Ae168Ps1_2130c [Pseudonocardia sp. Ae168_Ps1]OLL86140.1 hypothetical protein Ae263Ps1_3195 [Pseudonocardia sp. Ae263_Ps1]OLL93829.1 hypothetical protein Ae356Ps1_3726c [Pseudonocardia sp. Ae356_Ps1]
MGHVELQDVDHVLARPWVCPRQDHRAATDSGGPEFEEGTAV